MVEEYDQQCNNYQSFVLIILNRYIYFWRIIPFFSSIQMGAIINRKRKNQLGSPLLQPFNNQNGNTMLDSISLPGRKNQNMRTQARLQNQMQLSQRNSKQYIQWYQKVYFTPQSKFILIFKAITLALIYLYFVQIPITIAFQKHRNQDESQRLFQRINIPAIVTFIIGVLIKLKTAFYREGILISGQKQVLVNYFLYIFIFDFLSITSIVVYEFAQILRDRVYNKDPLSYRFIVLLFYLKITELFDIQSTIVASFDLNRRVKAFLKLILLMAKIFIICNFAACCFFYISDTTCPMTQSICPQCCWIYKQILGSPIKQADWIIQYTFSLYWGSTTMLTIGYGDITPQNLPQAVYTVSAQFISCVIFAFSINQIWSIIQQKNSKRFKIHSRMNVINVYMRDKNVSPELKSRVNAYLSHFYHTKNLREKQLQHQIISELTPSLRKQLFYQSYGFLFKTHIFFENFTSLFLEQVSEYIRQVGFFQEQIVYEPEAQQQISIYYIHKGQLQSYIELGNARTKNVVLQQFQRGQVVGLYEFVRQINYRSSLMALKYTLLYVLDYNNWINTIQQYDEDYQIYYKLKHNAQYQQKYKKLNLQCRLCGSQKHQPDMCLQSQIQSKSSQFLANYLRKCYRMPYTRRNFKTTIDIKSQHFLFQPTSSSRSRVRKASFNIRKQNIKQHSNKKKIFHKKAHHQKMNIIIQKKMKESVWESLSEQDIQILGEVVLSVDSVQNYQYYWPIMNATTDINKDRRRNTFNRILLKQ